MRPARPYGYKKAERTTDQLVPDENTAPIVQRIFEWASSGLSTRTIANKLNEQCVIPPLKYRVECRDNFTPQGASRASDYWNYTTVKRSCETVSIWGIPYLERPARSM